MFLECTGQLGQTAEGVPTCSGDWIQSVGLDLTPIETLNATIQSLFTFDAEFFGIALGGAMLLFSTGWGAGKVVRLLSMRING